MPGDALHWTLFCRVVDNFGDAGVCWRLAADLAARGQRVRLVIDDPAPLAWMAPDGAAGVEVMPWSVAEAAPPAPGDVVVEAFGCDPPDSFVQRMAARPPLWINLEYLSAEDWVERAHGLPSPQPGGLRKWFLFPGFTARTAGLLREPGLLARRAAFDGRAWLAARGWAAAAPERVVVLFSYANPRLADLCAALAAAPTLLLVPQGPAQAAVAALPLPRTLRVQPLPWLTQRDFDHLLWSADLNLVRGEDSLVRALWAGAPFVWQAYPQHDGVHHAKVEALLARMDLPAPVAALWRAWNGHPGARWPGLPLAAGAAPAHGPARPTGPDCADRAAWPAWPAWQTATAAFRERLAAQTDLTTWLLGFAKRMQGAAC